MSNSVSHDRCRQRARTMSLVFGATLGCSGFGLVPMALAQVGTAITYQGEVRDVATNAVLSGTVNVRFRLYDTAGSGTGAQIGPTREFLNVTVVDGKFTVPSLDFGDVYGSARWLEIDVAVVTPTPRPYATLSPRQRISPTPNAIAAGRADLATTALSANTAATATSATNSSQLGGVAAAQFPTLGGNNTFASINNFGNSANTFSGTFTGGGAGLTNLNATNLATGTLSDARLSSNVALLNTVQTFTGAKTFNANTFFNGRIGVGTTTPEQQLALSQGLGIDQGNTNTGAAPSSGTPYPGIRFGLNSGEAIGSRRVAGGNAFGLDFFTTNIVRMQISTGGNVGIGATGTLVERLEVAGGDATIRVRNVNDSVGGLLWNSFGAVHLGMYNPGTLTVGQLAANAKRSFFAVGNDGRVGSTTNVNTGNPAYRNLLDDGNGNLLVGTSNNESRLSVGGGIVVDANGINAGGVYPNGLTFGALSGEGIASRRAAGPNQNGLDFYTGGGGVVRMSITNGGFVGIGTQTPASTLDVNGPIISRGADFILKGRGGGIGNNANNGRALVDGGWGAGSIAGGGLILNFQNDYGRVVVDSGMTVNGRAQVRELEITGGSDLAESFDVNAPSGIDVVAGMVVVIDPDRPGELMLTDRGGDTRVAGVISGANGLKPGMIMAARGQQHADGKHPVALTGRVWTWCDATAAPIRPGDRLTTAAVPGHAAPVSGDVDGAVIGKAMTSLESGRGLVLVLVNLQ